MASIRDPNDPSPESSDECESWDPDEANTAFKIEHIGQNLFNKALDATSETDENLHEIPESSYEMENSRSEAFRLQEKAGFEVDGLVADAFDTISGGRADFENNEKEFLKKIVEKGGETPILRRRKDRRTTRCLQFTGTIAKKKQQPTENMSPYTDVRYTPLFSEVKMPSKMATEGQKNPKLIQAQQENPAGYSKAMQFLDLEAEIVVLSGLYGIYEPHRGNPKETNEAAKQSVQNIFRGEPTAQELLVKERRDLAKELDNLCREQNRIQLDDPTCEIVKEILACKETFGSILKKKRKEKVQEIRTAEKVEKQFFIEEEQRVEKDKNLKLSDGQQRDVCQIQPQDFVEKDLAIQESLESLEKRLIDARQMGRVDCSCLVRIEIDECTSAAEGYLTFKIIQEQISPFSKQCPHACQLITEEYDKRFKKFSFFIFKSLEIYVGPNGIEVVRGKVSSKQVRQDIEEWRNQQKFDDDSVRKLVNQLIEEEQIKILSNKDVSRLKQEYKQVYQ